MREITHPTAAVAGGFCTQVLRDRLGHVKLPGLPHIIVRTPLGIYLFTRLRTNLPRPAGWLIDVVPGTIVISRAFDDTDVLRYLLGDQAPRAVPAG